VAPGGPPYPAEESANVAELTSYRADVYTILRLLDGGETLPDDLIVWLPLAEAEGLIHYLTDPADCLPSSYPLLDGSPPAAYYLELTAAGRQALQVPREGGAG
jgi:hypothetical protein